MLSPADYIRDVISMSGSIIPDHSCLSIDEIKEKQLRTQTKWAKLNPEIPFDPLDHNSSSTAADFKHFNTNINYNLIKASKRQANLIYQVSLPHFQNPNFLSLCLERYKKFLLLKKLNPNVLLTPCLGVKIITRAHKLNPIDYFDTIRSIFVDSNEKRSLLDEDDDECHINMAGCEEITRKLWEKTFGEKYFFAGGMSRGEKPDGKIFAISSIDMTKYLTKIWEFNLISSRLRQSNTAEDYDVPESMASISVLYKNEQIFADLSSSEMWSRTYPTFRYNPIIDTNKSFELSVQIKFSNEIINRFIFLNKTLVLKPTLSLCEPKEEAGYVEEVHIDVKDPVGNAYVLEQTWRSCFRVLNSVMIELVKGEYEKVRIRDVLSEYGEFIELKKRVLNSWRDYKAIRARHKICATLGVTQSLTSLFKFDILHVKALQWYSVKILSAANNKSLATSHLICQSQLPSKEQLSDDCDDDDDGSSSSSLITYDPKTEKSMLVRNINGDAFIVKGTIYHISLEGI